MTLNSTIGDDGIPLTFKPFIFATASYLEGCANQATTDLPYFVKGIYTVMALFSMVSSVFVALTIFYN